MLAHTLRLQVTITAQLRPVCLRSFSSKILKTQLQINLINQLDKIDKSRRVLSTFSNLTPAALTQTKKMPDPVVFTSSSMQRIIKKKLSKKNATKPYFDNYKVKSYATADFYNLASLKRVTQPTDQNGLIDSGAYEIIDFITDVPDNCLCVKPKYPEPNETESRHIFFFEEGTVVFWNVSQEEQSSILQIIQKHSELFYTQEIINEESEYLSYSTVNDQETDPNKLETRLDKNHIYFKKYNTAEIYETEGHLLEKYAFSDAISLSVQLGIWETKLDHFTDKIEYISDDLKRGKKLQLELDEVLQKLGELFTMRHMVNLNSNFLETPDFYWDRDNLEALYSKLYYHLSVSKRTKLFNDKLNHCIDLMQILNQHLNDKKHTRLEWIIIGLIAIEVAVALGIVTLVKDVIVTVVEYFQ